MAQEQKQQQQDQRQQQQKTEHIEVAKAQQASLEQKQTK
jgi:hypothetical protein